ncbi:MAG: TIGR00282 family metallophosphoesterase [Bacillota bacterium]|jgi:metallophosphoesterase (TIGR00282 family)|nr:TIGR00282 family metallophosphoesterase [Thermoanaerobacteraceae bacterium]
MRILMIGDIVGRPGRRAVKENLAAIRQEFGIDFTIANGENIAGGNGVTRETANELFGYGIDVLTGGNHIWDKKESYAFIAEEARLIRPANYPPEVPGAGYRVFPVGDCKVAVVNLLGRVFMPGVDCPFRRAEEILAELSAVTPVIVVDFHAEATSEKMAFGWFLDGRVSAVLGTHTHVQTADERVLPGGTAYISDVGMTGPRDSVIGVKTETIIAKYVTQLPKRFEVAGGPYQFDACVVTIDPVTGKALGIERIRNFEA